MKPINEDLYKAFEFMLKGKQVRITKKFHLKYIQEMTIEKSHNGIITISDIINSQFVKQRYAGFTLAECKRRFKIFLSERENNS